MTIETQIHVYIEHGEFDSDRLERVLKDLPYEKGIEDYEWNSGSAASFPYIHFWCRTMKDALRWESKFKSRLKKYRIELDPKAATGNVMVYPSRD